MMLDNDTEILAYVAIGSNLGDSRRIVADAVNALDSLPATRLCKASSLYRSEPIVPAMAISKNTGAVPDKQPDFINAVVALHTCLSPLALLVALQAEETRQGRTRSVPNAPRTLDLDLLLYADEMMDTSMLTLPHPRMHLRGFVLVPLSEIASADLHIPGRGSLDAWLPAVAGQRVQRL